VKFGTQIWGLITVVVVIAALAAGWFLGVSPQLTAQAQAESQRQAALAQNQGIRATIENLQKQKDNLPAYEKRAAELRVAIPSDLEGAAFIRSLNDLANASGVTIEQISINEIVAYSPPGETDKASPLAPDPVTDSRITSDNFLLVPVSLSVSGGWNEVLAFTHGVQTGNRLTLVTKVSTTGDGTTFTTTLDGAMYVLIRQETPAATAGDDEASDSDAATDG
jgi:Tfp pilus assembly protein PilO